MTGYGTCTKKTKSAVIEVSVKTVNGRFLESKIQLPREYAPWENEMRQHLQKNFERGNIFVYVSRQVLKISAQSSLEYDAHWAELWLGQFKKMAKALKLDTTIDAARVAELSGAIRTTEIKDVDASEKQPLMAALSEAIKDCVQERSREGQELLRLVSTMSVKIDKQVEELHELSLRSPADAETRIKAKIEKLGLSNLDETRMSQEVVLLADRTDTREELDRLIEHIKALREHFKTPGPHGKKADFFVQEIFREINTVGSKSQSSEQTRTVVEVKTLIEQLREQIQNIE